VDAFSGGEQGGKVFDVDVFLGRCFQFFVLCHELRACLFRVVYVAGVVEGEVFGFCDLEDFLESVCVACYSVEFREDYLSCCGY
jgi:hypothetical protein